MSIGILDTPTLTFALAMTVGVIAQGIARHLFLPGIVVLLAAGVLLGPDVVDLIRPAAMGASLSAVVGFSVAVILFEGGLSLQIKRLLAQAKPIRRLITTGALVTAVGGAVAARWIMGWDWRLSILFGTLVIVTGPTVITPLVRRLRIKHHVATILEAEGIFIDAVGATIAVVALEIALAPTTTALGSAIPDIVWRIGVGAGIGGIGGLLLALLLRRRRVVPDGLENILALSAAVLVFELSNALVHESGISAAIAAGLVVGNTRPHALEEIVEFKEQLTVLLIATLFVLLAADVRIADVVALGMPGLITVVALMVIVRPLTVAVSTFGTELSYREKLFLAWLGPRGIVAAAVASLFALRLDEANIDGGIEMKALVFLVIATTVTVQGLSGGLVGRLLGVRRIHNSGYLILGANPVALRLAHALRDAGEQVALVDASASSCRIAEEAGFKVYYGNALEERMLAFAQADSRAVCIGLTSNESVNFLFAQRIRDSFPGPAVLVALTHGDRGVTESMVEKEGMRVLFGSEHDVHAWLSRFRRRQVETLRYQYHGVDGVQEQPEIPANVLLPLVLLRRGRSPVQVFGAEAPKPGDIGEFVVDANAKEQALRWFDAAGWTPVAPEASAPPEEPESARQPVR